MAEEDFLLAPDTPDDPGSGFDLDYGDGDPATEPPPVDPDKDQPGDPPFSGADRGAGPRSPIDSVSRSPLYGKDRGKQPR